MTKTLKLSANKQHRSTPSSHTLQQHCHNNLRSRSFQKVGKVYKCTYCSKKSKDKTNMQVHLRLHTGSKPFECNYCQKQFTALGNKKDHERRHLKERYNIICAQPSSTRPYKCELCQKRYYRRYLKTKHLFRDHIQHNDFGNVRGSGFRIFQVEKIQRQMPKQGLDKQQYGIPSFNMAEADGDVMIQDNNENLIHEAQSQGNSAFDDHLFINNDLPAQNEKIIYQDRSKTPDDINDDQSKNLAFPKKIDCDFLNNGIANVINKQAIGNKNDLKTVYSLQEENNEKMIQLERIKTLSDDKQIINCSPNFQNELLSLKNLIFDKLVLKLNAFEI